ncbi:heat shock protein HspQ, partial [Mesorhizobium sp.]|uniref:heat shock protein HspQ n=1 Tax=Mesorhizobium sp. TaxID=1871066 RepID=UPI0025E6C933
TEEWYEAIPADVRPRKDQPFYHLLAENSETEYIAYVSEQNLLEDRSGEPVRHPQIGEMFEKLPDGRYEPKRQSNAPLFCVRECACAISSRSWPCPARP